ncbi:protein PRD1 isoform X3 [Amborella trichopoda]|uniref:protein PRD1 isoform X3 n=1 Tax=Amborella trichopoda TaxID=13333 RepID=UPI0009C1249E|nr:protein PRD1 isoform X3 [Amborella trichopoda]|eukprot:XP_020522939.1 protein PRD1 isoform X3 [Amborella trichopoda]
MEEFVESSEETTCNRGHRASVSLETEGGGRICLSCFSNLISDPFSPSIHVSYALSQLSIAMADQKFRFNLLQFHAYFISAPLVCALSTRADESIAQQIADLIADLCSENAAISGEFFARIADLLSSRGLSWSRSQIYTLHCFGILLDHQQPDNGTTNFDNKENLIANLIDGLQLPSDEIRGELTFVLYKLSILEDPESNEFLFFCPRLLYLTLEALLKTQNDDVRTNCLALLTVLAQKGYFDSSFRDSLIGSSSEACNFSQTSEHASDTALVDLFVDAIKGPLLSSEMQVQISALNLIFHSLLSESGLVKQSGILVEEGVSDYVFEILRLSENRDPLIVSCIRVLDLLANAEETFRQKLAVGFVTLVRVLRYISEIPLHPVQAQVVKLVWKAISSFPGIISKSQAEELMSILTSMLKGHTGGESGPFTETFTMACSAFVSLLKTPSSHAVPGLQETIHEAVKNSVISCLSIPCRNGNEELLYSLYFLKEAFAYCCEEGRDSNSDSSGLSDALIDLCETHILPHVRRIFNEVEDENTFLGVLEVFHSIILRRSDHRVRKFTETLVSSSWFSLSFGCLGLFPTPQMKERVFLMLSLIIKTVLGWDIGHSIAEAYLDLPSDPMELLFLLGQKSSHDSALLSCQSAILSILYTSSLYNERLADENQILASLEQYILVNISNLSCGLADSIILTQLVHLYSLYRGFLMNSQIPFSMEAEKLLFHLIAEGGWDMLSLRIHKTALKWLFQQDEISGPMSNQILSFCKYMFSEKNQLKDPRSDRQVLDTNVLAEIVVGGDNNGASLLVSLLKQLQEACCEDDSAALMDLILVVLNIFPDSSNLFCSYGLSKTIKYVYHSKPESPRTLRICSLLVFNILRFVDTQSLSNHESWLAITLKVLDFLIPTLATNTCNHEGHLLIAILSLMLYRSTDQVLLEASKAILLNTSLGSALHIIIQAACEKGPALADQDKETSSGETLNSVLLFYFFVLRSLGGLLQEQIDWHDFLQSSQESQKLSVISVRCHDLCRLIHFGSSSTKLIASSCLLELLTNTSSQRNRTTNERNCSVGYIQSVMAVLEGLVFHEDVNISMSCSLCLSILLGWEKFGPNEKRAVHEDKWCRFLMEELALSLAAPSMASRSLMNQHRPLAHLAIALLRLERVPTWMKSVFEAVSLSGIISNLSASKVTVEMVLLFQELLRCGYLTAEQIRGLHSVFQVCRKHAYMLNTQDKHTEDKVGNVICIPKDLCHCLLQLANLYSVVNGKGKSESPTLPDSIGLCYIHRNKVFLSNELRIAYSPRGNFSLRDFHHAVNSMPADCFLPEQMTSAMLESSAQISTLIGFLSTEGLYSWGTKGIQRKLILISTFFTESISASREMLMDAADNCITIEFLMIESEAILLDKVPHAGVFSRNIKEIVDDISDLENCSFRRCSWDKWSFCGLAKRLLQELLDYFEEPLQAVFRFKNGLAESINQISCNLFASAINIIDGFNPCQTCRCHGLLIEDVGGHKKKHPCPATNQELAICDVLENAVKIGEQTVLFLPSFQSLAKLQQSSNPIIFDVTELTNLASLSEGVILGIPYIVTPSSPHDIESATDESDNKLELNLQLFAGICQTLYSLDQGLVCTSHCNTETLREATFPCFYLLQPSDKGPMLLRRIAGSEEILPIPDAEITSDSGAPVEMKRSIEASFSRIDTSN